MRHKRIVSKLNKKAENKKFSMIILSVDEATEPSDRLVMTCYTDRNYVRDHLEYQRTMNGNN